MNRFFLYLLMIMMCVFAAEVARAADLKLPDHAVAGQSITIGTSGDGSVTLYLFGPGQAIKRSISLGHEISLKGEDLRNAGLYTLIISGGDNPVSRQLSEIAVWISQGMEAAASTAAVAEASGACGR